MIKSYYSLKNHGADKEVDAMFDLGEEVMRLPLEEKKKYEEKSLGDHMGTFG